MKKYFLFFLVFSILSCKDNSRKQESLPEQNQEQEQLQIQSQEEEDISNLIQIMEPSSGDTLRSPVTIKGQARGTWFFEGDFPIYLLDENGNEITVAIATAQGDWMTEEWVDFSATMEFEEPPSETGVLRFEKNNPSDRRELDRSFEIEMSFK